MESFLVFKSCTIHIMSIFLMNHDWAMPAVSTKNNISGAHINKPGMLQITTFLREYD